jgi:hypothetical protein
MAHVSYTLHKHHLETLGAPILWRVDAAAGTAFVCRKGVSSLQDTSLKAAVLSVNPADNNTVYQPVQPPSPQTYTGNTTAIPTNATDATTDGVANATTTTTTSDPASTNATTVAANVTEQLLSTTWEDAPSLTWQAAPACSAAPGANNTSKDDLGRLWGWEADASCAFKDAAGLPLFTFELAPVCMSVVGTSRDAEGRLWGWENGMSCKILHIVSP